MKSLPIKLITALCLIVLFPCSGSSDEEIGAGERFISHGSGIVFDRVTDLEWLVGPDQNTNWDQAKSWVDGLGSDDDGWRMPTSSELNSLYKRNTGSRNMTTPLLKTTGWWIWSGETRTTDGAWSARAIFLRRGNSSWLSRDSRYYNVGRGFAVRSKEGS